MFLWTKTSVASVNMEEAKLITIHQITSYQKHAKSNFKLKKDSKKMKNANKYGLSFFNLHPSDLTIKTIKFLESLS